MKLKAIVILFNVLIGASFLVVVIVPSAFLGSTYTDLFWSENWPLALAFVAILAGVNAFFRWNWEVFRSLEDEDWNRLAEVLDRRVRRSVVTASDVRLLAQAYLLTNRTEEIRSVESVVRQRRPGLLRKVGLELGVPHVLAGNPAAMRDYYASLRELDGGRATPWVEWHFAFALLLNDETDAGIELLRDVAGRARDERLEALAWFSVARFAPEGSAAGAEADAARVRIAAALTAERWDKRVASGEGDLALIALGGLLRETRSWLYGTGGSSGA